MENKNYENKVNENDSMEAIHVTRIEKTGYMQAEDPFGAEVNEDISYQDDGFDFEGEEKPKIKSKFQQARSSSMIEIEDDKPFIAVLKGISSSYLEKKQMGIISFEYDANCGNNEIKQIEDKLFFDYKNDYTFKLNYDKLNGILRRYDKLLTEEECDDVHSIANALQGLVGTKVELNQKTRNNYKNYEIVSVVGKE